MAIDHEADRSDARAVSIAVWRYDYVGSGDSRASEAYRILDALRVEGFRRNHDGDARSPVVEPERRAPVLATPGAPDVRRPRGTIAWSEHEEAWLGYLNKWPGTGALQDAERIAARGGFGYGELQVLLGREPSTWLEVTQ